MYLAVKKGLVLLNKNQPGQHRWADIPMLIGKM